MSNKLVERDLLERCADSGKTVLKPLLLRYEESEQLVLEEHTELCSVSGNRVRRSMLCQSVVGQRYVLVRHFVSCAETGILIHPDEVGKKRVQQSRMQGYLARVLQ